MKEDNLKRKRENTNPKIKNENAIKNEKKIKKESKNYSKLTQEHLYSIFHSKLPIANDHKDISLVNEHDYYPIWVTKDCHIFVETFCIKYNVTVYEFIIAIAEPVSRPNFIHEFKITEHSLFAAVSQGLDKEKILNGLIKYSKVPIPQEVEMFITSCSKGYGIFFYI